MAKPVAKVKINDIAKDFGMTGKDMLAVLKTIGIEKKSSTGSLEPEELNKLFEFMVKETETEGDIAELLTKGVTAQPEAEEAPKKKEKAEKKA